jgi:AAA15 family ATPase/GTPase
MEKVKHIKNITVENFKCFEHFSAGDFGIYNIILGDNNVGKTSFLESLLFDENISQTIENFQTCLSYRQVLGYQSNRVYGHDPFVYFINNNNLRKDISLNINFKFDENLKLSLKTISISEMTLNERELYNDYFRNNNFSDDNSILRVELFDKVLFRKFNSRDNFEKVNEFVPFLFSSCFYSYDLIDFYIESFSDSKILKKILIGNLQCLIADLNDIEISLNPTNKEPTIVFWLSTSDKPLPLPMFGDGTIRLFRMIMEIVVSKNKYLCIDEIDTGVHFSKYKDFCRIVLQTAKANNVQLFMSTHNNEFLKSFKEVLEEEGFIDYQKDTKSFTLKKLPNGNIKAYEYTFEQFEFAIEQENELR